MRGRGVLESVVVPVSDVDRAKDFYTEKVGFDEDLDHRAGDRFRVVQLTPPGSGGSIAIGTGLSDIEAARAELVERGVEVGEIQGFVEGAWVSATPPFEDWNAFVFFNDPDGNGWAVQQGPARD